MASFVARSTGKILLLTAIASVLGGTAEARTSGKVIAKGGLIKGSLIGYAQANAASPKSLSVRVTATPAQKVKMQWSVVCSKGVVPTAENEGYDASTAPKVGQSFLQTPGTLKLPLPLAHPKSCSVTVYATLPKKGKQTLEVIQG